jgi:hypothetical protein
MKQTSKTLLVISSLLISGATYAQSYSAPSTALTGTGANNTVVGGVAAGGSGGSNTVIGNAAGLSTSSGANNSLFGYKAGSNISTGGTNTFIGSSAGAANTQGGTNCYFGANAASSLASGNGNTIVGTNAGLNITSGGSNCFFGLQAGTNFNGLGNVCIGPYAGSQTALGSNVSNKLYIGSGSALGNTPLIWGDFAAQIATINGSFGVGTMTPFAKFDVLGTNATGIAANFSSAAGYKTFFMVGANANFYNGLVQANDNAIIWDNGSGGATHTNGLVLAPWNGAGGVRIDATGVTTIQSSGTIPLTVTGASSNLKFYANGSGDFASSVNMRPHFASGTDFSIYEGTTITGSDILRFEVAGTTGAVTINASSTIVSPLKITNSTLTGTGTYAKTPFEVTALGQVFIGPTRPGTSPYNATTTMLSVSGNIVAKEIFVANTAAGWADYVFKKDYKLMSIAEVEKYISFNQHLPNVPSAAEVEATGQNIGDLQVKQMEKTEELYLYLIEMNKKLEAQHTMIEAQDNNLKRLEEQNNSLAAELANLKKK